MEGMKKFMEEHQDEIDASALEMVQNVSGTAEIIEEPSENAE